MWCLLIFAFFTIPWANAQGERSKRPFDNGHGWDIRLAVPGEPGNDYPTLNSIPRTTFTCSGKDPGYYADVETNCQVFRVCTLGSTYGFQSFLCPNGTLFNQEVFVCDWWMNVNCQKSREINNNNNEKFRNLKLGPQFMTDIKKMITHPIRNPYDRSNVKNNLIFMQVYKPPLGQLYNEALLRNLERNTNDNFSKKTRQEQKSYQEPFTTDITSAASTPTTQYIPNYIFQNQLQNSPYSQLQSLTSNAHGGQTSQTRGQDTAYYNNNIQPIRSPISSHTKAQIKTYNNSFINKNKQAQFGLELSKQSLNQNINKEKQLYTHEATQARFSKDTVGQKETETKQNLVSKDSPPTLITKTLAFRKIIKDSKDGTPKSRITFKTWIVRPSKSAKLTIDTSKAAKLTATPYFYNRPRNNIEDITNAKLNIEDNYGPYNYNPPKINSYEIDSTTKETPDLITSTTSPSVSTTPLPTKESLAYVDPTTFNPLQFTYLPPDVNSKFFSRQYLLPNIANNQLVAAGSSPSPFFKLPLEIEKNGPKFSITKQSLINTNNNNLSFSDILTKEKLDISVNDIVKETNNVLQTVSPEQITKLDQKTQTLDYSVENYLPYEPSQQSDEQIILQPLSPLPHSSRLIVTPSTNLEPPIQEFANEIEVTNQFSKLPYIKKTQLQPNTIERMVSLKITLPENVAKYLFKNSHGSDSSNIEILNTQNSNYLVLTNKLAENGGANLIPIAKLTNNKITNISDSQDLVFSFLADSINAAKEYSNIAQQNILYPTPTQQFQNIQNDQLQQISQDISRLTSSQFTGTHPSGYYRSSNAIKTSNTNLPNRNGENKNILSNFTNSQKQQAPQDTISPSQNLIYSANSDKIYSGQLYQLPVPVVTKQIYNSPIPSISNYILSTNSVPTDSPVDTKQRNDQGNLNEVEIIPSQTIPTSAYESKTHQNEQVSDQGSAANIFIDNFRIPANAIRTHVRDNIIGTIPHPLDEDKFIEYKKDQSYYIYTHLNNNYDNIIGNNHNTIDVSQQSREYAENSKLVNPSFQLLPSLSYKLEDEKEKQNFLNAFQIDNFGNPKQNTFPNSEKNTNIERRQDIISTDVDFTISHPTSSSNVEKSSYLSALYDGPSSYSAPQSSVGSLTGTQNYQSDSSFRANLEKIDTIDNNNGYPKISPLKKFTF